MPKQSGELPLPKRSGNWIGPREMKSFLGMATVVYGRHVAVYESQFLLAAVGLIQYLLVTTSACCKISIV